MDLTAFTPRVSTGTDRRIRLPDGRWLGYAEYGDSAGRPVMSFHGGLSCRLDIRFASALCREMGVRLISIDRPGIGLSDDQRGRTLVDWPGDVAHLAGRLGIERFAALGWSVGGPYAIACAYAIPDLLTHVGTVGCIAPVHGRPETVQESGLRLDRILFPLVKRSPWAAAQLLRATTRLPSWLLKRNLLREVVSLADRSVIAELDSAGGFDFFYDAFQPGPAGAVRDYLILGGPWGFSLQDVTKEIHLWQGQEDRLVPECQARWLLERLPGARLHPMPGEGHFLMRRRLREILDVLTA